MGTSSIAIHDALFEVSCSQSGFFTAKQAISAGYVDSVHAYHVSNGDWIKVYRGIYRLSDFAPPERPELVIWSLWSRGHDDIPQGIYCRETALAIHGLIDLDVNKLHMYVPPSFRRNSEIPSILALHKENVEPEFVEKRQGFYVTSLSKTISDMRSCINPKISAAIDAIGKKITKITPESNGTVEYWEGPIIVPTWGDGRTFEEALRAGED